jgi:Glycosyl transferase family 64 domain
MKGLVMLANAWLTVWEQARGRRQRPVCLARNGDAGVSGRAGVEPVATVVILNWQRPANVRAILDTYVAYRRVSQIIVWSNNDGETFTYYHPKVRLILSAELGLNTRWAAALLAENDCVIVADDDLIADESTIEGLIENYRHDPDRAYTLHGRNPTPANDYSLHVEHVREPTEAMMHLTRLTCLARQHVAHYFVALDELGLRIDPATGGGEDIVMSFALTRVTGKRPLVVPGRYRDLLAPGAIANRHGPQQQHRTQIMRRCQAWLAGPSRIGTPPCPVA